MSKKKAHYEDLFTETQLEFFNPHPTFPSMKQTCGSSPEEGCDRFGGEGLLTCKDPEGNRDTEWKKTMVVVE